MALPTIATTDFIGVLKITGNQFRQDKISEYIDFWYPQIVENLVGSPVLYQIENADTLPEKYTDLFDGVSYYNIATGKTVNQRGLIDCVKLILYAYIVRDDFYSSSAGNVKGKSEVSDRLANPENNDIIRSRYNLAVRRFNNDIIPFLINYTNFEQGIDSVSGDTCFTTETKYLAIGDTVTIDQEYEVLAVTDGVSFQLDSNPPATSANYTSNPFEDVVYCVQDVMFL